LLKQKAN